MKKIISSIIIACFVFCCLPLAGNAYYCRAEEPKVSSLSSDLQQLEIKAKSCVLMDKKSGKVLLSLNENDKLPVASMTKMMALDLVMNEIYNGKIGLNQQVVISENAASMGGSQCFLDAGESYSIYELIKSVVVASANDSTVALAEAVSGSEKMFVSKMNERAKALGMVNTNFVNSTGLDETGHVSTARDMAVMMRELSKHELLAELGKVWMYDMNHSAGRITSLTNTNRLIKTNPDVQLAKTGHTDDAGFCITAYAERDGKELVACVMGEENSPVRFLDCTKLLNYGFTNFENKCIVDNSLHVGTISVKGSTVKQVNVYPSFGYETLIKSGAGFDCSVELNLKSEVVAPLSAGEVVGEMIINVNGERQIIPLEIREAVIERTMFDIIKQLMK